MGHRMVECASLPLSLSLYWTLQSITQEKEETSVRDGWGVHPSIDVGGGVFGAPKGKSWTVGWTFQ